MRLLAQCRLEEPQKQRKTDCELEEAELPEENTGAGLMALNMMEDPFIKKGNEMTLEKLNNSA